MNEPHLIAEAMVRVFGHNPDRLRALFVRIIETFPEVGKKFATEHREVIEAMDEIIEENENV